MSLFISADNNITDNLWWKDLFQIFANPGDYFEIHCWFDESRELKIAQKFGEKACYGMPDLKIIHGTLTDRLISYLLNEEKPGDCTCYNKMVPFFTIRVGDHFSSEKYGTEIILKSRSPKDEERVKRVLKNMGENIKMYQNKDNHDNWRIL